MANNTIPTEYKDIDIGKRVREERYKLSISRAALARKLNVSDRRLSKIESGDQMISAFELLRIAHALEVDPFDLFYPRPPSTSYRGEGNSPGLEESLNIFEDFVRDCVAVDHLARPTNENQR